jgi:hypothetical protein
MINLRNWLQATPLRPFFHCESYKSPFIAKTNQVIPNMNPNCPSILMKNVHFLFIYPVGPNQRSIFEGFPLPLSAMSSAKLHKSGPASTLRVPPRSCAGRPVLGGIIQVSQVKIS